MNADGGNPTKITDHGGRLSPDGKKTLYFEALVPGSTYSWEIFVSDAAGGNALRLTNNQSLDADPFWSPDGKRIASPVLPMS